MQKKTIILGAPKTFGITDEIIKNLNFLGFNVIDITFDQQYRYKNLSQKINNIYHKIIYNDKSLKTQYRFNLYKDSIYNKINQYSYIDYTLIIRPDNYPIQFLKELKSISENMIGYQWDGLNIFPDIKKYFSIFDRFFVFDQKDISTNILPTTNFYFDYNKNIKQTKLKKNIYFLGSFVKNRIKHIQDIIKEIEKTDFESDIYLVNKKRKYDKLIKSTGAKLVKHPISFQENLNNVKESSVLIDFQNNKHCGLSFRIFEALQLKKKILTNNAFISQYDFYDKHNFYIFHEKNMDGISEFLDIPYREPNDLIINKYSFTNWIKYVLNIDGHIPIDLPSWINNEIQKGTKE